MRTWIMALGLVLGGLMLAGCGATDADSEGGGEKITTRAVAYEHDGVKLEGYLAMPADTAKPRPGVLVIHEWWGHNAFAREQAERLARAGYVAFAADMYGKGVLAETPEEAMKLARPLYENRDLFRARTKAGLDTLAAQKEADGARLGAIGYCFGGAAALELARSGADVDAVVSFHGSLGTSKPAKKGEIKATVLVCNGYEDPMVKQEERQAFMAEMSEAGADWVFIEFSNAVHSFTNPEADERNMDGVAYNEKAARRAWEAMLTLFEEKLKQ